MPCRSVISREGSRGSTGRGASTIELIKSLGGGSAHERRVARIAARLFDLLSPLHSLGASDRRLLRVAALLHDCGRSSVGAEDHHVHGAKIVADDRGLPLTVSQRRAVTYLVRYHCGRVPRLGKDDVLLRGDGRRKLRILLGLLRAADGMDSRRLPPPAIVARLSGRRLRVRCVFPKKLARARRILHRKAKFDLLERAIEVRVKLRVDRIAADAVLA